MDDAREREQQRRTQDAEEKEMRTEQNGFKSFAKLDCAYCWDGEFLLPEETCPHCGRPETPGDHETMTEKEGDEFGAENER